MSQTSKLKIEKQFSVNKFVINGIILMPNQNKIFGGRDIIFWRSPHNIWRPQYNFFLFYQMIDKRVLIDQRSLILTAF